MKIATIVMIAALGTFLLNGCGSGGGSSSTQSNSTAVEEGVVDHTLPPIPSIPEDGDTQ